MMRKELMMSMIAMASALASVTYSPIALAGGPPPAVFNEVHAMVLVDVTGSMADPMNSTQSKLEVGLKEAIGWVNDTQAKYNSSTPVTWALWAFDKSYTGGYKQILPAGTAVGPVLTALGTPNSELTPKTSTPFAQAACASASFLIGDRDMQGYLLPNQSLAGWDVGKAGVLKLLKVVTDGLENDSAEGECFHAGDITSSAQYGSYETNSWQYRVRNKLLTGNADHVLGATVTDKLIMSVDLVFTKYLQGLSNYSNGEGHTSRNGLTSYSTSPTLYQAMTLYDGLAKDTSGTFRTVTVDASGQISARKLGDVDYSGCVNIADYNEMMQWYGQTCVPNHPHCYWADLNGDGVVDDADYMILSDYWEGSC